MDVDTLTPLYWAPQGWHLDAVQVPLNHGVEVRAKDGDQSTLLNAALQVQHLDITWVLLEHHAKADA